LLLISACTGAAAPIQVSSTTVPTIAGWAGNFDVVDIDQAGHRLYAADRADQGIDVFDTTTATPKFEQTIPLPAYPNGLAIAPDLGLLYVGTSAGSVVFVDISSTSATVNTVVKEVPTGGKSTDLLDYAAKPQLVFASNGIEGTVASIDAKTGTNDGSVHRGAGIKFEGGWNDPGGVWTRDC